MVMAKTVGVLILIAVALWAFFALVHFLAATIFIVIELLIAAAVVVLVYRHFKRPKGR
jgi:hypothetical protein